jgi:hypothetical protein
MSSTLHTAEKAIHKIELLSSNKKMQLNFYLQRYRYHVLCPLNRSLIIFAALK